MQIGRARKGAAISNLNFCRSEFAAIVKPVDAELGGGGAGRALVEGEGRRVPALGEARGTRIHEKHIAEVLFELPDVRVTIQVNVDLRLLRSACLRLR